MKYKLIKELYDCFYTPPELSVPRQEIAECHKTLIEVLEKPERRLVLQIIDAKDRIAEHFHRQFHLRIYTGVEAVRRAE